MVAFSEAQQDEIEQALNRLAEQDKEFRAMLDVELEREVNNQLVGLLVKNLENIQGDERDIIILSICYGKNPPGKMYMNFGPINKSGGEKRLNVAFSRAKKHMCVVSSITGAQITNDYNDGAKSLKDYLSYAEASSAGERESALALLCRLSPLKVDIAEQSNSPVADLIAKELAKHGWTVEHNIGQSRFRCDLGVRKSDETTYRLGILLDGDAYYEMEDPLERDVMRPRLLEAFGWNVAFVLTKDWYLDPEGVMERIKKKLE